MPWQPPSLTLDWPPYSRPSAEDQAALGATVREDLDAGLITRSTAVEKRAEFYGITDVAAYVEELQREAAEKAAHAHDMMKALGAGPAGDDEDDDEDQDDPAKLGKAVPPKPDGAPPRGGQAAAGPAGNGGGGDKRPGGRRRGANRRGRGAAPGGG